MCLIDIDPTDLWDHSSPLIIQGLQSNFTQPTVLVHKFLLNFLFKAVFCIESWTSTTIIYSTQHCCNKKVLYFQVSSQTHWWNRNWDWWSCLRSGNTYCQQTYYRLANFWISFRACDKAFSFFCTTPHFRLLSKSFHPLDAMQILICFGLFELCDFQAK